VGDPPGRPGRQCRAGRSAPAPFGGDAFAGDDAEGVAQDRDPAKEEAVVRPQADQFGLHDLRCSLVQLARVVAGLGDPVAQAINADAQFPGNMAHGNVAGPGQQDRLMAELRGIRGNVRPVDRYGQISEAGIRGSWQVGGGRSRSLCGYRHGDNASTGHEVSLPGQCGRCAGDCPLFGCKSRLLMASIDVRDALTAFADSGLQALALEDFLAMKTDV